MFKKVNINCMYKYTRLSGLMLWKKDLTLIMSLKDYQSLIS